MYAVWYDRQGPAAEVLRWGTWPIPNPQIGDPLPLSKPLPPPTNALTPEPGAASCSASTPDPPSVRDRQSPTPRLPRWTAGDSASVCELGQRVRRLLGCQVAAVQIMASWMAGRVS